MQPSVDAYLSNKDKILEMAGTSLPKLSPKSLQPNKCQLVPGHERMPNAFKYSADHQIHNSFLHSCSFVSAKMTKILK